MVALRDGRKLIGVLRSWDQFGKIWNTSTTQAIVHTGRQFGAAKHGRKTVCTGIVRRCRSRLVPRSRRKRDTSWRDCEYAEEVLLAIADTGRISIKTIIRRQATSSRHQRECSSLSSKMMQDRRSLSRHDRRDSRHWVSKQSIKERPSSDVGHVS